MKIGIDVSQMCYEGTGVARYVYGLTRALLNESAGHEFVLFAGTLRQKSYFTKLMQTSPWKQADWKILPLPPKLAGLALNAIPLHIESLIGSIDIFHTSDWAEPSSSCPRVTTVHDLVFKKYPSTVDPLILSTQTKRLKKIVAEGTHVIADSLSTKIDLVEIYGLAETKIDVIYPGLDPIYKPQSLKEIERVKTKYRLPKDYILSLGKDEPRKNLERLIKACDGLSYPLVLTGQSGWGKQSESVGSSIIRTGYIEDADLPGLYSGAHVFAYPSLYEGFGFPVLEAMACGTPVVTSNISSLPEIVGDAGILVDPLSIDLIKQGILHIGEERGKYINLGIARAQNFNWESTAKQVMEVYEKIKNRD